MKLRIKHFWQGEQLGLPAFCCQPPEHVLSCGFSCVRILQGTCTDPICCFNTNTKHNPSVHGEDALPLQRSPFAAVQFPSLAC